VVSAVVLSWNRREDTLASLRSLAAVDSPVPHVILVDNASTDGTVEAVRRGFPGVELIENPANLGFAEGNDVGIRRALAHGAEHVLVLNNDTEVDPGFLGSLLEEAARRPDAGALCPKILFADPPDLIWFAGAVFDPRSGYNGRHRGYREPDDGRFDTVVETDRACGAAMLVPRKVLQEVGVFDPALFAYSEDTDWSLRARAAGYRLYVVPGSRVWHKVSAASGGESSPTALYYDLRNSLVVAERHASLGAVGTWRRRLVVLGAHLAQAARASRRRECLAATWQGWRDFRSGRLGRRRGSDFGPTP
jgi:GT2 family glycosyltransferase